MVNEIKNQINRNSKDLTIFHVSLSLGIIMIIGFIIRFYYLQDGIPLIADGLDYFTYAYKMAEIGNFPKDWALSNNGWPAFVSIILSIINADTFLENTVIQRLTSMTISILTAIPIFFLCNRFFNRTFSLIGVSIFIFEPRIILNSTMGLTEPIYILFLTLILFFSFKDSKNATYISFFLAGIFAILRWEGLLLIFGLVTLFIFKNKHKKKDFKKLFLGIMLFLIIVIPISYINLENTGKDGLISPLLMYGPGYIAFWMEDDECPDGEKMQPTEEGIACSPIDEYLQPVNSKDVFGLLLKNGIENTIKFFGWTLIPSFIVFFPISIILIVKNGLIKNWNSDKTVIVVFAIILLIPALYAFSRNFNDLRYLYVIFPILSLVSLVFVRQIFDKHVQKKVIYVAIIIGLVIISLIFLEERITTNSQIEIERYEVSKFLVKNTDGVNLSSFTKYFKAAEIEYDWPNLPPPNVAGHMPLQTKKFVIDEDLTLEEFIKQNKEDGLTHLVVENMIDSKIFPEVYDNPKNYPFLEKIYDGKDSELISKVKIFRINYDILDQQK